MRITTVLFVCGALVGCRKGTGTGTGGGGGGGWLVGSSGLMINLGTDGVPRDYALGSDEELDSIACRDEGEAWVAGANGTLLYTDDGGESWLAQVVPTTAHLRALATQDAGPVFVAGDGVFFTSSDTGAHWRSLGDGAAQFRSVAAAQRGATVLALADDGALWAVSGDALVKRGVVAQGAGGAVAVSPDGHAAIVAGHGLARSLDGGATWRALAFDGRFADVRIDDTGEATAVGERGLVAHVSRDGHVISDHVGTADLKTLHVGGWGPADTGYTAGVGGDVFVTHDGGWSWAAGPVVGGTVLGADQIGTNHR